MTKYMISFRGTPENYLALTAEYRESYKNAPKGFTILGFWHSPFGVFVLVETDNWKPVYAYLAKFSKFVTFDAVPVLDTKEAVEALEY